jgi:hypothetical protein
MPLNPTNQNKTGILLPNPTAPRFDTAFAAGNRQFFPRESINLRKTGPGTPDPTFNPDTAFTYLGAFRIPYSNEGGDEQRATRGAQSFCLNSNKDGFFIGGPRGVAEYTMPTLSMASDYTQLPTATKVQPFISPRLQPGIIKENSSPTPQVGWMKVIGSDLFMGMYDSYQTANNPSNLIIARGANDLSAANYQGFLNLGNGDKGCRYIMDIPEYLKPSFSNSSHFIGVASEPSIIGRASHGYALLSWSPETIDISDTSAQTNIVVHYPGENTMEGFSASNDAVRDHFKNLVVGVDGDYKAWMALDTSQRITTFEGLPQPDSSLIGKIFYEGTQGLAFIPEGSRTVVFLSTLEGSRYGVAYKYRYLETGPLTGETGGFAPISRLDRDVVINCMSLDDVINSDNTYEPSLYHHDIFDGNRWMIEDQPGVRLRGSVSSGDYDRSTGLLYVMHTDIPLNQYESQIIISVYQVGVN